VVYREYEGACGLQLMGNRLLLVTDGKPSVDKLTVTFAAPTDPDTISASS
jgi:hypothetical protein